MCSLICLIVMLLSPSRLFSLQMSQTLHYRRIVPRSRGLSMTSKVTSERSEVSDYITRSQPWTLRTEFSDGYEVPWARPVNSIKGVGPKTVEQLGALGIATLGQLLLHFPSQMIDRRNRVNLQEDLIGTIVTVEAVVERVKEGYRGSPYVVTCRDMQGNRFSLTYFLGKTEASKYSWLSLAKVFKPNGKIVVSGKLGFSTFTKSFDMVNPEIAVDASSTAAVEQALVAEPVYGLTAGLTAVKLRGIIKTALEQIREETVLTQYDYISPTLQMKYDWPPFLDAVDKAHNPTTAADLYNNFEHKWVERLAFDELVSLSLIQSYKHKVKAQELSGQLKSTTDTSNFAVKGNNILTKALQDVLPFELTSSQKTVSKEIFEELQQDSRMIRCVQGDVGSGKTLVATMGILNAIEAGKQAALLAPTEILAQQHYGVISDLFDKIATKTGNNKGRPNVRLITGQVKGKAREAIMKEMESGEVDVVVGTHALITESVASSFSKLGLVVIDEEQRFGVNQRDVLADRSNVIYTTATPIPRSLMLAVQEDYTVSTLTDKPPSKRVVNTVLLGLSLTDKIIERIKANIDYGSKVFWVTPCLSPSANMPESSAQERYDQLHTLFPGRVAILHGKMNSTEKQEVMARFSAPESDISILVSTTVVEVGVDVPDASICVIDRAEQFGLSQMHQIRGRIGRGEKPPREIIDECYCVLLYDDQDSTQNPKEKLQMLSTCNNGFEISEKDLLLRGPGDIFGFRQHGNAAYKVASIVRHSHLLLDAQKTANQILAAYGNSNRLIEELLHVFQQRPQSMKGNKHLSLLEALVSEEGLSIDNAGQNEHIKATTKKASTSTAIKKKTPSSIGESRPDGLPPRSALPPFEFDPSMPHLNYENDVLEIMAAIGVDRDEEAVKAYQSGAEKSIRSRRSSKAQDLADFSSQAIVPLSPISYESFAADTSTDSPLVVVLDLETTGLQHKDHRIIQIAAKVLGDESSLYNAYIRPVGAIVSPFIADLTGIEQAFLDAEGMSFQEGWDGFKNWLREVKGVGNRPVVMLAHNGKKFDYDFLAAEVHRHCPCADQEDWYKEAGITAFVDSLLILREDGAWPNKALKPKRFRQGDLYEHVVGKPLENGHNAIFDILALEEILLDDMLRETWIKVANKQQFIWNKP